MIDRKAIQKTQRAQAADWQALVRGAIVAPDTAAAVATPRRNPLGIGLAVIWLVLGGGSLFRLATTAWAPGTAPALSRIALFLVYAMVALLALYYVLFTAFARVSVTAGVMTYRGALRTHSWQPGEVTGFLAVNTSTQPSWPQIRYVVVGPGTGRPVLRGGRFSADSMAHIAAALGLTLEVRPHRVTSKELLDIRAGRGPLPGRAAQADG